MADLKPIETVWHGCRFRSRLEARWAVFFEALGIEWEYEQEGFELEDGTFYLPDFLLHGIVGRNGDGYLLCSDDYDRSNAVSGDLYVEVKGRMTNEDYNKVRQFAKHRPIYIVTSIPFEDTAGSEWFSGMELECYEYPFPYNFNTVDGDFYGAFLGINNECEPELFGHSDDDMGHSSVMKLALRLAALCRFEHGERPEDRWEFELIKNILECRRAKVCKGGE